MKNIFTYIFTLTLLAGCAGGGVPFDHTLFSEVIYSPTHATGFEIRGCEEGNSTLIVVKNPWQGADDVEQMLLIDRDGTFNTSGTDIQRIDHDAKRIICMSSSYVAMLSTIGKQETIAGVSGINFISDKYVVANSDKIGDVGYDNNINYEMVVALNPDLVLLYGVMGASGMESKLRELGIPYLYLGEYVESSPLGKAEWMVAVGEITGARDKAVEIFSTISERYTALATEVSLAAKERKQVMLNTPYRDSWFIPSEQNYIARIIRDAGGEPFTIAGTGNSSQPIDIEQAYIWASEADVWLNVGACNSLEELIRQNPKFADVKAVREKRVYNNNARQTTQGGSDFWESGVVRPDVILQDLVTILQGNEGELYYYKQLK
jgi:iron complex transport system substrate-binding protein